jgi:signal transduction histidine kinase
MPAQRGQIVLLHAEELAKLTDGRREYYARHGIRTLVGLPVFLGAALRGALTLRFTEARGLTPEEWELLLSFSNHTALAMELTRLSRVAREAAVTEERQRFARDIHDTLAQGLAAILRQLESVRPEELADAAKVHIATAADVARDSLVEVRRSIQALRPTSLEGRTLEGAIQDLVRRSRRLTSARISLQATGPVEVPTEVEDELLRIVHESLTNAIKHAAARFIQIDILGWGGRVRITVRDDGAGFEPPRVPTNGGLRGMNERAQRIGALLSITSKPGRGTEVCLFWPAAASSRGEATR